MPKNLQDRMGEILAAAPVLPVVVIDDVADAVPLARALKSGGLSNIEVTLRTDAALDAIAAISDAVPGMVIGAGTVFSTDQVKAAVKAGVSYIVSPGYSAEVHEACRKARMPYLPGAVTATEIQNARALGFRYLKFFPAEASGGVKTMKALAPVFAGIKFCATGGITFENLKEYRALSNIAAVGLSAVVPAEALARKDWARITALAVEAQAP